jgi:hypothetical protein
VARHSTPTTRENPRRAARCPRCETAASCKSCAQYRRRAWRLTGEQGLTVELAAARMRLPVEQVEHLLDVERNRRHLKLYVQNLVPAGSARVFVDRHLERHPELTRAAIAKYLGKQLIDFERQLGYRPRADGTVQQTLEIPTASQLMIALGHAPNELDGC